MDVPCLDEKREAGWKQAGHFSASSDYLKCFGTSAVRGTDVIPCFQRNRVECRNYWAISRPTTYEPITRKDRTFNPVLFIDTADGAGVYLSLRYFKWANFPFTHTSHTWFFLSEYSHVGLTCLIHNPCVHFVHICVFEVVEKAIIYIVLCLHISLYSLKWCPAPIYLRTKPRAQLFKSNLIILKLPDKPNLKPSPRSAHSRIRLTLIRKRKDYPDLNRSCLETILQKKILKLMETN